MGTARELTVSSQVREGLLIRVCLGRDLKGERHGGLGNSGPRAAVEEHLKTEQMLATVG